MRKRPLRQSIARGFLAATGWRAEGPRPDPDRYVLIAAPHTTNWDFPYLLAFATVFDLDISWMGKSSLFRPPFGRIMRALGGIPIVRHQRGNLVAAMTAAFDERERLGLVVPAEGTRAYVDYWKSGFYHIARSAGVPIVPSYLDYARRRGGFGPAFHPTDDLVADMDRLRTFYADKQGRYPERFGRVRLREEDELRREPTSDPPPDSSQRRSLQEGARSLDEALPALAATAVVHEDR